MDSSNNKEQDLQQKEQEIRAKEAEIRLRELELELYKEQNQEQQEIPNYETRKHEPTSNSLQKMRKKIVRVGKFLGFTVLTIALMKVAFTVGMWLAYGFITIAIVIVGYQIFMQDSD